MQRATFLQAPVNPKGSKLRGTPVKNEDLPDCPSIMLAKGTRWVGSETFIPSTPCSQGGSPRTMDAIALVVLVEEAR